MKKKQGYALGSLLLGAASWLCLLGLRHIEKRMKKKQENDRKPHRGNSSAVWFSLFLCSSGFQGLLMPFGFSAVIECGRRSWQ